MKKIQNWTLTANHDWMEIIVLTLFQGDIDQLVLIDDPSAASQQCMPHDRQVSATSLTRSI